MWSLSVSLGLQLPIEAPQFRFKVTSERRWCPLRHPAGIQIWRSLWTPGLHWNIAHNFLLEQAVSERVNKYFLKITLMAIVLKFKSVNTSFGC